MALERDEPVLACGTPLQLLIDELAQEREPEDSEHVANCPYCGAALATLRSAREQLRGFAREPVAIPAQLSERIVAELRALRGSFGGALVIDGERGTTEIGGRALGLLARVAALSVPGVALASVQTVEVDPDHGGAVRIALRLAIELGPSVDALTVLVRAEVDRRLARGAGAAGVIVDVEVADVLV